MDENIIHIQPLAGCQIVQSSLTPCLYKDCPPAGTGFSSGVVTAGLSGADEKGKTKRYKVKNVQKVWRMIL